MLTFEPCQNTSCVSAREVLNIPVDDSSGHYLNMVYNYSLVLESLVLNSYYPENNIIDINYEMGTFFIQDNDGNAYPFPHIILQCLSLPPHSSCKCGYVINSQHACAAMVVYWPHSYSVCCHIRSMFLSISYHASKSIARLYVKTTIQQW